MQSLAAWYSSRLTDPKILNGIMLSHLDLLFFFFLSQFVGDHVFRVFDLYRNV